VFSRRRAKPIRRPAISTARRGAWLAGHCFTSLFHVVVSRRCFTSLFHVIVSAGPKYGENGLP